ncbi:DUF724 domain-containing protein 6-like isoform X2 [Raphanus sativus]|uniref:DUF724 domain-containing protein 6-like isoform X2 n=1 Tax=Raphanus sativus TaxID=3726 RepID=A0A9W3DMW2_RAPSA|nr:DUF724 domain-containing protein 6-like isoform X2 [Raphanus sativus]
MLENQEKEEEEKLAIAKDSEVEVCSEEEGFVGAWYRAILEDSPTKSRRIKLRVRYTTLLKNDCSAPLTEAVQQSFIRPVPPEDLYDGVVFVEGSVVDADLKDGWWEGVVAKKLEDEQYLVCFDTPPDILQFNRKQLRPHLDWTGSQWVRPEIKELSKSLFSSGTMVEVSRGINRLEAAWVPAIVVTEVEAGVVVKSCYKSLTFNAEEVTPSFAVDVRKVRPVPPPSSVEEYILSAPVDAFNGSAWRRCVVTAIRTDKSYQVSFVGTKEKDVFKHSDLRPSMEWEDGVWLPKKKLEKDTPPSDGQKKRYLSEINALSRPKKLKVIRSCGATKPGGSATVTPKHVRQSPVHGEATEGETELHETVAVKKSGNQMAGAAATPVTTIPIEKESAPPVTSVIKATPFRTPDAETQVMTTPKKTLHPMSVQTGEKTAEEHNNKGISHDSNLEDYTEEALIADTNDKDDYDQPLSAWIQGGKSSNDSDKSKMMYPTELSTPDKTTGASEDTTVVLPFVKRSPVWKAIESMEVYKKAKQNPHFTPLLGTREELREGLAAGVMVNFSSLLERVTDLHLHTPKSILEGLKECFYESEKYGFDVAEPISRIAMLVSLVEENFSREDKLKEMEKGKAEAVSKVEKVREDLRDVECKILELQNQKGDLKVKEDAEEKKIAYLQMCAEEIDKRSQEAELKFQEIVSASW